MESSTEDFKISWNTKSCFLSDVTFKDLENAFEAALKPTEKLDDRRLVFSIQVKNRIQRIENNDKNKRTKIERKFPKFKSCKHNHVLRNAIKILNCSTF